MRIGQQWGIDAARETNGRVGFPSPADDRIVQALVYVG